MSLILFNKPFGVLSQFRADDNNHYATLSEYFTNKSLRVAGRLDATSEGLLLLTDDGKLNHFLTTPKRAIHLDPAHGKTYWVQVAGIATSSQITQLATGVALKDGITAPALVKPLGTDDVARLWAAPAGIGKRAINSWLSITLFEGKNRQIRRMCAHVGLPVLRLTRVSSYGFDVWGIDVGRFVRIADKRVQAVLQCLS